MITKKTTLKNNIAKTVLIIVGIIVAIILSVNSSDLLSDNSNVINPFQKLVGNDQDKNVTVSEAHSKVSDKVYKVAGFLYGHLPSITK